MTQEQSPPYQKMLKHLVALKMTDDRGPLAMLRRGAANPLGDPDAIRIIGRDIPSEISDAEVDNYLIVACLFALNPNHSSQAGSFGTAIRNLQWAFRRDGASKDSPSVDARFRGLIEAPRSELPIRMRHLFQMLGDKEIWVDYGRLIEDLDKWEDIDRHVQRAWARDYWRPVRKDRAAAEQPTENTDSEELNED